MTETVLLPETDEFAVERKTYIDSKPNLLKEARNKFVLIKGKDVVGIFETRDDAIKAGILKFPGQSIYTRQIIKDELHSTFYGLGGKMG